MTAQNIIRFVLLLLAQVLLFNSINFLGYINPYPYILFVLLFPVTGNRYALLLSSFLLGLLLDMFCNSGGVHAAAITFLAFVRPNLLRFSFGLSYEYQTLKISDKITTERITYLLLAILLHHSVLFFLEIARLQLFFFILKKITITSIATFIISLLILYLIKPNKR